MQSITIDLCDSPAQVASSSEVRCPSPPGTIAEAMLRPLTKLSNEELWRGLLDNVFQSRGLIARQIAFLAEVERRRLWARFGYSSLGHFCTHRLGMSEDATWRRCSAARLALHFPVVLEKLQSGEIHLSALHLLRKHLNSRNHLELIEAACDKTKREIDELL